MRIPILACQRAPRRLLLAARERIVAQFDERFLRLWRYYLGYCECAFRVGSCDLMQITLEKPG